ncbi:MAG: hypothetical protein AMXMBFR58_10870 [Phycisphaerae bacterium]|nr:hypothetical protein [Phycisphaerales bacterium]MCK6476332.1 flagellar brake protein [Phycisphaerales bacterium]
MPASRSRTERWRDCLHQVFERNGGIELSLRRDSQGAPQGSDLVWRVRLLGVTDDAVLVEAPNALGRSLVLEPGTELIAAMAIGQNRWMFHTTVTGVDRMCRGRGAIDQSALRLTMPDHVERCSRRSFYRMSTAQLTLPSVECWALRDPASAIAPEVANRSLIQDLQNQDISGIRAPDASETLLPDVGPMFHARLVNIGGGGAGLVIDRSDAAGLDCVRNLWLRIDLRPEIPAPIAMTARCVHTHIDSAQNTYAGLAFDFAHNPGHRDFVVSQITRYVEAVVARRAPASKAA